MKEDTGLQIIDKRIQETPEETAVSVVQLAIQRNLSPEMIEKLMDLQERHQANEAKKAYTEAMALFKADPPVIEKDRTVSYQAGGKDVLYHHASLANVTGKINAGLGKYGLSAGWITLQNEKEIKVTCTITHKQGHSESTSLTAAPDTSGSKNSIQAIGSTISYLERYTLLALTGLATMDMDDDGGGPDSEPDYLTPDQVIEINDLIKETKTVEKKFLEFFKAESVEKILAVNYQGAITLLKKKKEPK